MLCNVPFILKCSLLNETNVAFLYLHSRGRACTGRVVRGRAARGRASRFRSSATWERGNTVRGNANAEKESKKASEDFDRKI